MVRKYGPELGALYYEKTNAWETAHVIRRQNSESDLVEVEKNKTDE